MVGVKVSRPLTNRDALFSSGRVPEARDPLRSKGRRGNRDLIENEDPGRGLIDSWAGAHYRATLRGTPSQRCDPQGSYACRQA